MGIAYVSNARRYCPGIAKVTTCVLKLQRSMENMSAKQCHLVTAAEAFFVHVPLDLDEKFATHQ